MITMIPLHIYIYIHKYLNNILNKEMKKRNIKNKMTFIIFIKIFKLYNGVFQFYFTQSPD